LIVYRQFENVEQNSTQKRHAHAEEDCSQWKVKDTKERDGFQWMNIRKWRRLYFCTSSSA